MVLIFDNLDERMIGIYLEHNRNLCQNQLNCKLTETLFDINEPFYMQTEKEALIKHSLNTNYRKRKRNKKNLYYELFTESQKNLINKIINKVKNTLVTDSHESDNSSAKQTADIALKINNPYMKSGSVLCNDNGIPILSNEFIIPPKCSFMCCQVIEGLKIMQQYYKEKQFEVCHNFDIVIDPPWVANKSVKRKHCYQTDYNKNILEMTQQLNQLILLFPNETHIKIAVWTTHKEKDFVINQMLSILDFKCTHILIWHKITKSGESVKLRGGLEYLIIASNDSLQTECLNGILVSIPSAIHSHKPPLQELLNKIDLKTSDTVIEDNNNTPVVRIGSTNSDVSLGESKHLTESIYRKLNGLELYARYLNAGFHSIGYESIKLQHRKLFNLL